MLNFKYFSRLFKLLLVLSIFSCSKKEDKVQPVTVSNTSSNGAVLTYHDIPFALSKTNAALPHFFSTETGLAYKNNEVSASNGNKIDIAFSSQSGSGIVNYFTSPDDSRESYNIPGATTSKFKNYITSEFSVEEFDTTTIDQKIKNLIVENDENSFGTSLPKLVFFQNALGKKGVIKVKSINSERILTDIKVQK